MKLDKKLEDRLAAPVKAGRYASAEEYLTELLDQREQQEAETDAIREAIAEGQAELDRGEYVTEEQFRQHMAELAESFRQRQ